MAQAKLLTLDDLVEPILEDDYIVYANFYYIVDGRLVVSDWHEVTVREFKHRMKATEIRRCDIERRAQIYEQEKLRVAQSA